MKLWIVVTSIPYETYNEFKGAFSSYERAAAKVESLDERYKGMTDIIEVELDDMNFDPFIW